MKQRLKGKRAIVTGGGSGIGRAATIKLTEEGASVGVLDIDMNINNRREFLQRGAALTGTVLAGTALDDILCAAEPSVQDPRLPWYRRCLRWGQTWLMDRVPDHYDIAWWRDYWKRTAIQGVVLNAGGTVAFYPSKFPLHLRAKFLNGRDLYGELAQAAHEEGLAVLARMDSSCAAEEFFSAHPDWFARKQSGEPYKFDYAPDKYITCINSPYYDEYMPGVLQEIIERTHPEGIIESAWSRLTRDTICYCENCVRKFRNRIGQELPQRKDWNDAVYRKWIQWNYERYTELWDFNNRVTQTAGGPHCVWNAMLYNGGFTKQNDRFYDVREIGKRREFFGYWDGTVRPDDDSGFQQAGDAGKLIHQVVGWDKAIIRVTFVGEGLGLHEPGASMGPIEGIAGGLGPLWVTVGANQYDRRMYHAPERIFQWHIQYERYLTNRRPVAVVGVVWSQRNADYYGRDDAADLVDAPYRGFTRALIRGRIPYLPVHASDIEQRAEDMAVLILPNVGTLSDAECGAIRQFARRGGAVIASGATSLYNEWGDARPDFALAGLFGAHAPSGDFGRKPQQQNDSYLWLTPQMRGKGWESRLPGDPASGERHPVLRGFEETDIIPFGGELQKLRIDAGVVVPLTFVPPAQSGGGYEEAAEQPQPKTDIPGLVLNVVGNARIAYLQADLDRRYAQNNDPDHGNLLANIVRWAASDRIGFELQGPGLIDCHVYRQLGRAIVHLVNLNSLTQRNSLDELLPVGPLKLRLKLPEDVRGRGIECLVSRATPTMRVHQNWANLTVQSILDHEVLVIGDTNKD